MIFRKKLRYILVETSGKVDMDDMRKQGALGAGMLSFLGELSYFKANPHVAAQLSDNMFVLSVNRGYERDIVLALSFIKELMGARVGFYTIRTSGTIRSLKDYFAEARGA